MKIMSLDLSTKSSGLAIFDNNKLIDYKLITASSNILINRIQKITGEIKGILSENPDIEKIILEEVQPSNLTGNNLTTHKALMWAQAAIAFMVYDNFPQIKLEFIYASSWRKECGIKTGAGIKRETLKKKDIEFVQNKFNITVNDDIADAICIGYAYNQINNVGFFWE